MSIRDLLAGFIDNIGLAERFAAKKPDPAKARKPLLTGIKRTREQFNDRKTKATKAPNKWWKVNDGVVALTVKAGGSTFDINGVETNHIPEERFIDFLAKFEEAVNAGEFDKEIASHGNGTAKVPVAKASKASSGGSRSSISNVRSSVSRSLTNGKKLADIEADLKSDGKYPIAEIDAVIAEKRAQNA